MHIDDSQHAAVRQCDACFEDWPVPDNGRAGQRRLCRDIAVVRRGHEIIHVLRRSDNRPAAQNNKIMPVARFFRFGAPGMRAVKSGIFGLLKKRIEGRERAALITPAAPPIDLLQAQYICL